MEQIILKSTLMSSYSDTRKYQWKIINPQNFVFWRGTKQKFEVPKTDKTISIQAELGVQSAEECLRELNGLKTLKKRPLGYGLFFFIDGEKYGVPMRILERFMMDRYGTERYVDRWSEFYDNAVLLIRKNHDMILEIQENHFPNSTHPLISDVFK